ncbi:MAG TPA: hypothetical protein PKK15_09915 [Kouleothrix sp.]|uniref:hypothetical protein n=1 Tax=Kouleothrix sp. TaxID=2779161 RepID=UPI002B6378FE|nr:hypothetical protein [Kouleothrix sp.]
MDAPATQSGAPSPRRGPGALLIMLRAALPYVLTALAAVALSLLVQSLWQPTPQPAVVVPTREPPAATTVAATPRQIATAPTALPLSQGISQQELADVRAEADRKQAQIYLLLAIVQIDDAEAALRSNELASVDQSLVAIDSSLQLAYDRYERAGDSASDAVAQRRMEVSKMHDDLYLYPEHMDQRLNTLRQLTLALITEPAR